MASAGRCRSWCTGGAGQLAGPIGLCAKLGLDLAGLEIALRDLDDLAGNAQRVVAATATTLETDVPGLRRAPSRRQHVLGWLAAADEVAAAELRLKFRTGGLEAAAFPAAARAGRWIDAALDRETPFKCTAGLHNAVRHTGEDGFEHHGFLNVLVATRHAFDGASVDDAVIVLEQREGAPWSRPPASSTSPAPGAGSRRSAPARSPSRWRTCASPGAGPR